MASISLQCKPIKPNSETAARGSLDRVLGKTYLLEAADKGPEAAPGHVEMGRRIPLQNAGHGKQVEPEEEASIIVKNDISDLQSYSPRNLSGEPTHFRPANDEEAVDLPQILPLDGEEKEGRYSLYKETLVTGLNRDADCIVSAAEVMTGIGYSVLSDEPTHIIAASEDSLPLKSQPEGVYFFTEVKSSESAMSANLSAAQTNNFQENHQKIPCLGDTKVSMAAMSMSPKSCDISLASLVSEEKLKLDPNSKKRIGKRSKKNEAESCNCALKDNSSLALAEPATSEVFLSHASNDFFLPTSKKRVKLRQSEVGIVVTKNVYRDLSMLTSVSKKKKAVKNESSSGNVMSISLENTKSMQNREAKNPDNASAYSLWKEAKLAAEENARLSVGKSIHPFFSRQRSTNVEEAYADCLLSTDLGELPPSLPYHVTQDYKSREAIIDWKNLKLLDAANILQSDILSIASKCFDSKCFDSIQHSIINGSGNSWVMKELGGHALSTILFMNAEDLLLRNLQIQDLSKVQETRSIDSRLQELFSYLKKRSKSSCSGSMDQDACEEADELKLMQLKEILSWYYSGCPSSMGQTDCFSGSKNNLWTDKYQPRLSKQVCGNKDSLSFLNKWLQSWKVRIACERKTENTETLCFTTNRGKLVAENNHRGWSEDGMPNIEEEELCNVVLLTGSVGSGKSAAVYACAKEQGFTVLEINASEVRNGMLIKNKFGEAMESHGLTKWSADDNIKSTFSPIKGRCDNKNMSRCYKDEREVEMETSDGMDGDKIHPEKLDQCPTSKDIVILQDPGIEEDILQNNALDISEHPKGRMTLVLFEDVDVIFEEDRGFLAALVQLAKTTKRPLILTSNKGQPRLPQLDKLSVQFSKPSVDELVTHIFMVCISENIPIDPELIEHLVRFCDHDLRKLLMMLQFWGQGFGSFVQSNTASLSQNKTHVLSGQLIAEERRENTSCSNCSLRNPTNFCSNGSNIGEFDIPCLKEQESSSAYPTELFQKKCAVVSTAHSLKEAIVNEVPLAKKSSTWALQERLLFASSAQHCVLPHLLSSSYPCPLSQLINAKAIKAAQEVDGQAEHVAAQLAELKIAMEHEENRKLQRLKKELKASTRSPAKDDEIVTAVSNIVLEYGADCETLAESGGIIQNSPLHFAGKMPASNLVRRCKGHRSIVFSDSEDEGKAASVLPPEAITNGYLSPANAQTVVDMSIEDIHGSCSNTLGQSKGIENQDTMPVYDFNQINSMDLGSPGDKPKKLKRLRRPGSKAVAVFDVKDKYDASSKEAASPLSKSEKNAVPLEITEVLVMLEVNSKSQNSETHETLTDMALNDLPACISTEGTLLSEKHLLKDVRKFEEHAHSHDGVRSTNDITVPLSSLIEPLPSSRSPISGSSCMMPSSIDAILNFPNSNSVSELWSMLSESKEAKAMASTQTSFEAAEVSRLLASFGDILSASDVISTVKEYQIMDSDFAEEVASNLAQFGLGLCLQQCQNVTCAEEHAEKRILRSSLQSNLEHELIRHETRFQLQEALDSILSVKARPATKSAFVDFSTFIPRISQLEQLHQLNNPSRSRRSHKRCSLDLHTFPVFKGWPHS